MRGDFSSWNKDRSRNFRGALHQQGRVLLDRDWNAMTETVGEWQETAARDAFGAGVAAIPADRASSFKVTAADKSGGTVEISVAAGRAWADGLLVELGADKTLTARYLGPPVQNAPAPDDVPVNGTRDAVILETWLEELNAFQAPQILLEHALGGVDTTERVQTAFRLRLFRMAPGETCDSIIPKLRDDFDAKGKLAVELNPTTVIDGDCPVVEGGGFTGFEHRLYRIEIADVDQATHPGAHFKWSQVNGGLVGRGELDLVAEKIRITGNRNAIINAGTRDFYLEIIGFNSALNAWEVIYGATAQFDGSDISLAGANVFLDRGATDGSVFFRLWNGIERVAGFVAAKKLLPDQQGIFVHFEAAAAGKYTPSDFWTFEARAGGVGNPRVLVGDPAKVIAGDPVSASGHPPQGIYYHRVPLAEINWTGNTPPADEIEDCRRPFQPLTKLRTCCTFRVGDGVHSHGDFTRIQAAVDALPKSGGEICILPGIYVENVVLKPPHNRNITLKGCGRRSVVRAAEFKEHRDDPELCAAIYVAAGQGVTIESLAVEAHAEGYGLYLEGAELDADGKNAGKYLTDIKLGGLFVSAVQKSGIKAHIAQNLTLSRSAVFILEDKFSNFPAVYLSGDDMLIERTEIRVLPGFSKFVGGVPTIPEIGDEDIPTISDLLELVKQKTGSANPFFSDDPENFKTAAEAPGGLQIAGGSERVRIINNLISGGRANGISLGSVDLFKDGEVVTNHDPFDPKDTGDDCCKPGDDHTDGGDENEEGFRPVAGPPLYDLLIKYNRIFNMGRSGIGLAMSFSLDDSIDPEDPKLPEDPGLAGLIFVSKLVITENRIERCAAVPASNITGAQILTRAYGGISLGIVEELVVRDNFIVNNCRDFHEPVCGIFALAAIGTEISRNEITEHLPQDHSNMTDIRAGARGGIWIFIAIGQMDVFNNLGKRGVISRILDRFSDAHAVKIDGNVVSVPLGRALTVMTLGDSSVIGNRFTSAGVQPVDLLGIFRLAIAGNVNYAAVFLQLLGLVATNVLILDLGAMVLSSGFGNLLKTRDDPNDEKDKLEAEAAKAEAEAQTAEADAQKAMSELDAANSKAAANPSAANKDEAEKARLRSVDAVNKSRDARAKAEAARAAANSAGSGSTASSFSHHARNMATIDVNIEGTAATRFLKGLEAVTKGALIDFSHNQCKYNPRSREPDAAMTSVFVGGLADITFQGNQISSDIPRSLLFVNALILGAMIRINGNGFRESFDSVLFSAFSWGFLNNTSDNESVHCINAAGLAYVNRFNLVLRLIGGGIFGNIPARTYFPEGSEFPRPLVELQEEKCRDEERKKEFTDRIWRLILGGDDIKAYEPFGVKHMAGRR